MPGQSAGCGGSCRHCNRRRASSPPRHRVAVQRAARARWRGGRSALALAVTFVARGAAAQDAAGRRRLRLRQQAVDAIAAATRAGTSFVFGYLGGGPLPFDPKTPGAEFVLALQALPIVLVMSVLTTLLFYWRILPPMVRGFSWALTRTLGVGGAVGLVDRRQHLRRHGRGAAVHPAVSGATHAQRTVHRDDRRHGRHRRHRAGALRDDARPDHSRRRGALHHRLGAGRAGGDPDRPDHGAGSARCPTAGILGEPEPVAAQHHGRDRQGHDRRASSCCSTSAPC